MTTIVVHQSFMNNFLKKECQLEKYSIRTVSLIFAQGLAEDYSAGDSHPVSPEETAPKR